MSIVKSVPIHLDRLRHFRFDFNAFCALEDELGISIGELGEMLQAEDVKEGENSERFDTKKFIRKVKMKNIRALVWAGLIHEDETLTIKEAGKFIDMSKITEIMEKLAEAIMAALPSKEGEEKKVESPGSKTKSGAGKNISKKPIS